jgi:uncharacterized membrane protein YdjX (TVP38/TMEM64 family)
MKTFSLFNFICSVFLVSVVTFFIYGFSTDCPNTAGYVYCGNPESWSFPNWFKQGSNEHAVVQRNH